MAQISIVYTTEYIYRNPVGLLRHKLMVRPDDSHDLGLHSATLKVEPEPTGAYWKQNGCATAISTISRRRDQEQRYRTHGLSGRTVRACRRWT